MCTGRTVSRSSSCIPPSVKPFPARKRRFDSLSWSMTWGEFRKCRARSKSSERSDVGGDDDDACSDADADADADEELSVVSVVERGSDSDAAGGGCEPSSLLAVIARLEKASLATRLDSPYLHGLDHTLRPPQVLLAQHLSLVGGQ
jgi:hypothetical protein